MENKIEGENTLGQRLRAWRKSVPLKLVDLSEMINLSQGSLSDLENGNTLPSTKTLTSLLKYTDISIYWLLIGKGPVHKSSDQLLDKTTNTSQLYENFLYMMEDNKLKELVVGLIKIYKDGGSKEKAKISGFFSGLR